MKLTATYAVCALAGTAAAFPAYAEELAKRQGPANPPGFPWELGPPGSVRSPCPGCNTMANHGYINRNGIGITAEALQNGFLNAFGMGLQATQAGATNAINQCSSLTGKTCTAFNLDQLNVPHLIEHDGSLSRRDKEMAHDTNANNHEFNQTIWDRTLMFWGADPHIGIKFAATSRVGRIQQAQEADFPGWFRESTGASITEQAFMLSVMNDPALGVNLATPGANPMARVDWINFWFTQQKLPTSLGWVRPSNTITLNQINSLAAAVQNAPTVTANPGQSPYVHKRGLAEPQPSYNLEIEERDASGLRERNGPVPLAAAPSLIANPATAGRVREALASASAIAPPPPAAFNPYTEVQTPQQLTAYAAAVENYQTTVQQHFETIMGELGLSA